MIAEIDPVSQVPFLTRLTRMILTCSMWSCPGPWSEIYMKPQREWAHGKITR